MFTDHLISLHQNTNKKRPYHSKMIRPKDLLLYLFSSKTNLSYLRKFSRFYLQYLQTDLSLFQEYQK